MAVELVETKTALRERLRAARASGATVGFVPTMGALHAGHAELLNRARRDCALVVSSIFVNPIQFDQEADLVAYPRTLQGDLDLCSAHGVDVVFAPNVDEMYPEPLACSVDVGKLASHLCGRFRPGHFRGVATVVLKLFNLVQPTHAYFGEKDAQQLAVIRRMTRDLDLPIAIVGVPTVREADGLAMSSRNQRLNPEERQLAIALYQTLRAMEQLAAAGTTDPRRLKDQAMALLPRHEAVRLEYLELVDERDFQPVSNVGEPVIAAGALWVGGTRLIDNLRITPGNLL